VEFAVIAPVIVLVIMGIIEFARGLMAVHLLNNAAHAGCRLGILQGKTNNDINSCVVTALTNAGINGEAASVLVNDAAGDAANAASGDEITVTVTVPVSLITWVPTTKFMAGNLSGQYTMRRQ
jgi:Flp pilus assembly protein TadG